MSDRRGDSPVKTISLCDKATLIPLCETCKAGPPTAAPCVRERERERVVCFIRVYSTYGNCVVCGYCAVVHMYVCKYVPPTELCVCWGRCGRHIKAQKPHWNYPGEDLQDRLRSQSLWPRKSPLELPCWENKEDCGGRSLISITQGPLTRFLSWALKMVRCIWRHQKKAKFDL